MVAVDEQILQLTVDDQRGGLGLAPLPYDAVVSREPADSRMWSKLTPLPLVPAPGAVPGAILGQVVRRALTGDRASEEEEP